MTDFEKGIKQKTKRLLEPNEIELWGEVTKTILPTKKKPPINKKQKIHEFHYIDKKSKYNLSSGTTKFQIKKPQYGGKELKEKLDLHGMSQEQAYKAIISFVEAAFYNDRREVLVITGKGGQLNGGRGVLNLAVPKWFNEVPLKNWVRRFSHATRNQGGEGALQVIIRRKK